MDKARPFCIEARVWEAYKRVKANRGAAGVDGQSIAEFEEDLSNNLYRIWSRMSSGSYFPPAVLQVEIPKDNGAGVEAVRHSDGLGPNRPDGGQAGTWNRRWRNISTTILRLPSGPIGP